MEICPKCRCNIPKELEAEKQKILEKRLRKIEFQRLVAIKKLDKKNLER
jgi:hypothetical protein